MAGGEAPGHGPLCLLPSLPLHQMCPRRSHLFPNIPGLGSGEGPEQLSHPCPSCTEKGNCLFPPPDYPQQSLQCPWAPPHLVWNRPGRGPALAAAWEPRAPGRSWAEAGNWPQGAHGHPAHCPRTVTAATSMWTMTVHHLTSPHGCGHPVVTKCHTTITPQSLPPSHALVSLPSCPSSHVLLSMSLFLCSCVPIPVALCPHIPLSLCPCAPVSSSLCLCPCVPVSLMSPCPHPCVPTVSPCL